MLNIMAGIIFLIIAAFIFSVIGVVALLRRTSNQAKLLREYGERIALLEASTRFSVSGQVHTPEAEGGQYPEMSGEKAAASETPFPSEPPVIEAPAGEPALAETFPAPEPEEPEIAASLTETVFPPETDAPSAGSSPARENPLTAFIRGGNLWAAGGIILLIAAFAMLITYLAKRGFFTVEMGIAGAAVSGLVMIAAGWRFRKKRPVYFLLLQGGGIGILYLSIFAAHKLTPYFPPLVSLILMSVLLPPAIVLALFQGSQALALLGFLGGFAAPLLLASGMENHVFLFGYYGALDLGVLVIGLFRRWKGLNLLAFLCTFILANYWTGVHYEPALFGGTEPFFLAYILIFTILGVRGFDTKETGDKTNFDLALVLGTPMAGAVLQWKLFDSIPHGHALVSLIFSAFYILLAFLIWKRRGRELRIFSEGYVWLGMLLANLAIPLELAPRIASTTWAAEGAVVFFFGRRLKNFKTAAIGLILHLAAAIAFAVEQDVFAYGEGAFRSVRFIGSLVIALSALIMVFITERLPRPAPDGGSSKDSARRSAFPMVLGIWAFIWWFGGWSYEIFRVFDNPRAVLFLFCSFSALAAFAGAKFLRSPACRTGMIPSLAAGFFLTVAAFVSWVPDYFSYRPWILLSHNFFEGLFLWGWLTFFAVQALLLFFSRKDIPEKIHGIWLLTVIFIGLAVTSSSGRALTLSRGLAPSWTSLAGMAPVFSAMLGISLLFTRRSPSSPQPKSFHRKLIRFTLPLLLSCVIWFWFLVTLFFPGNPAPLPFYIPIINPLDLEEAFCIVLFLLWQSYLMKQDDLPAMRKPALFVIIDTAVFLFTITVAARSAHFYGGVPYRQVFDSGIFNLCLFILWAVYGIGHIIGGFKWSRRKVWIAGAVLTVVDVAKLLILDMAGTGAITRIISFFIAGLLLLFIGWAAPLPPMEKTAGTEKTAPSDSGGNHDA
jgi:uncharacterized membrane protein